MDAGLLFFNFATSKFQIFIFIFKRFNVALQYLVLKSLYIEANHLSKENVQLTCYLCLTQKNEYWTKSIHTIAPYKSSNYGIKKQPPITKPKILVSYIYIIVGM